MTIGQASALRIEQLCEERGITLNKLSTICGMPQATLSNLRRRDKPNPTISTIKQVCDGLGITIVDFFNTELFLTLEQEIR